MIDDVEKYKIEHYMNQGANPLVVERFEDHPRHKLDPQLEQERLTGNYKFKVCEPKHRKLNMLCPPCINSDLVNSHTNKNLSVPVFKIDLSTPYPSCTLDEKAKL